MTGPSTGPGRRHLLLAWGGYWAALGAVTLWRPLQAVREVTSGDKGSITAGFDNGQLFLSATQAGREVLRTGASLGAVIGWLVVPPLVILGAWMWRRASRDRGLSAPGARAALGEGERPVSFQAGVREEVRRPVTPQP